MLTAWSVPSFDRLFDSVIDEMSAQSFGRRMARNVFSPSIEVRENEEAIVFVCDVPGFKRDDLEVSVDRSVLSIKGERRDDGKDGDRVLGGRRFGSFMRSFTLPEIADTSKLSADLSDGVLTIRVAKVEKAQPRRIEIRSAGDPALPETQA